MPSFILIQQIPTKYILPTRCWKYPGWHERWPYVATRVLTAFLVPNVSNHQKMLLCMLFKGAQKAGIFHVLRGNSLTLYHFQGLLKKHLVTCEEAGGIARDMTEQGKCKPWSQEEGEKSMAALMCLPSPSQREGWRSAVFLPLLYWVSWKSYSHLQYSTHLQRKKAGRRVWLTPLSRLLGSQAAAEARNLWRSPPTQCRTNPFFPGCWISQAGRFQWEGSDSGDIWFSRHREGNHRSSGRGWKWGVGRIKVIKIDFPTLRRWIILPRGFAKLFQFGFRSSLINLMTGYFLPLISSAMKRSAFGQLWQDFIRRLLRNNLQSFLRLL